MAPPASPARGRLTLNWATLSIGLSVAGAGVSLFDTRLFLVGVILFMLGLVAGIVALRTGSPRSIAIVGIVLNAANLAFDAALLIR